MTLILFTKSVNHETFEELESRRQLVFQSHVTQTAQFCDTTMEEGTFYRYHLVFVYLIRCTFLTKLRKDGVWTPLLLVEFQGSNVTWTGP